MKKRKYASFSIEEKIYSPEEKQAEGKMRQMMYEAFLMPWLSVEKNNWWNERLHRIAGADLSTVFPNAVGIAATFNAKLITAASKQIIDDNMAERELNKQIIEESIVLLKNNNILPLSRENVKKIALIDFNTENKSALAGTDCDTSFVYTTILEGLKTANEKAEVVYIKYTILKESKGKESLRLETGAEIEQADIVILAVGMTDINKEKNYAYSLKPQQELVEEVCSLDKPTILLNFTDLCVDLIGASEQCDAILQCWYPGQFAGEIIGKMIFGDCQPSGKLPVNFYRDIKDMPCLKNYYTDDKIDRCFCGTLLYPFGYGLTYSFVEYYRIYLSKAKIEVGEDIAVTIFLKNKGKYETKDVVQVYLVDEETKKKAPALKLVSFKKVNLPVDEEVKVSLTIKSREMALTNEEGKSVIEPGRFSIYVGGGQPDDKTSKLYNRDCLHIGFLVE